jgi:hypothetical protein
MLNTTTVSAVFDAREAAERAVTRLRDAGFTDTDVSAVYADTAATATVGPTEARAVDVDDEDVGPGGGAVAGAITGGLIWLAAGPLGALVGAAGGAIVGSIAAGMINLGVPEEEARWYEGEVGRGRTLVTVDAGTRVQEARDILVAHGGRMRDTGTAF